MSDHYELLESDRVLVIRILIDTLDFYEITESAGYLRNALKERSYPSMALDLTIVEFIDSSVFGFLIELSKSITKHGSRMAIVCKNREILNIMFMLKINELIRIFPSMEPALEYLKSE